MTMKKYAIAFVLIILTMSIIPIYRISADSTTITVNPANAYVTINKTTTISVSVNNVAGLTAWQFTIYFLNSILNCTDAAEGPFLQTGGGTFFGKTINNNYNATYGSVVVYSTLFGSNSVSGSGVIATITFNGTGVGQTTLHLTDTKLGDTNIPPQDIPHTTADGTVYVQNFTLTLTIVGSGTVLLNNTGPYYHTGETVQLTANPSVGWSFQGYTGDLVSSSPTANLVITGNMAVTATFTQNVYTLTVSTFGTGTVGLNVTGPYHYDDTVVLTASASSGWIFRYWSGDLTGSANPAKIVMTGNFTVNAYFTQQPTLQLSPASKTCRILSETFTVAITISNAANVQDFDFQIYYNATMLAYVTVTWNAWGSGTINVNPTLNTITGSTSGTPISGSQTLVTIQFKTILPHIWKSASGWTNILTDTIYIQQANVSYAAGPDLGYVRGGLVQITVGPDFSFTFSPIQGDVNNDGTVDIYDLRGVAAYFGTKLGDPQWTNASPYDLNGDSIIDVFDLRIIAANYGYTYSP